MTKLFSFIQAVIILATISICGVSITIIPVQDANSQQQEQQLSADAIFKMVEKSVVGITRPETIEKEEGDDFDSDPIYDGSGFVYAKKDGNIIQIVTNEHVVRDSDRVRVIFSDGSRYTANVLGSDSQEDIAVLEIIMNASTTQQQQPPEPLSIGNSSELQIGEPAIAIGYPFLGKQSFSNLLTSGVISEIGVEVRGFEEDEPPILNAIVTDAATAGGNSGGPLLNIQGQVIGMTTGGDDDTPCCTYAIPSNTITHIVPILVEKEEYIHPYIGLEPITLSAGLLAESFEDLPNTLKGVVVTEIDSGGPAHKAGINGSITDQFGDPSGGDIITAIDGEPITTADEFNAYIDEHKFVGEKVMLTIYRNGQIYNSPVTLEKTPSYSSNNSSSSTTTTSDILTYQNSSYGIEIQYPANWTKDEGDSDPNDGITDIVEFISPFESRLDSYSENLGISTEELTDQNMTLEEYASSLITDYNETLTDFNLIESNTNSTLAGKPAYKLVYTETLEDEEDSTNLKSMEIGTIIGNRVYFIEYIAEEEKYSNYLPTIQMMINSIEIT